MLEQEIIEYIITLTSVLDDHRGEYGQQFWMCEDPPNTPGSLSETISQYTVKKEKQQFYICVLHITQDIELMN